MNLNFKVQLLILSTKIAESKAYSNELVIKTELRMSNYVQLLFCSVHILPVRTCKKPSLNTDYVELVKVGAVLGE
jgi:hypothetical protein